MPGLSRLAVPVLCALALAACKPAAAPPPDETSQVPATPIQEPATSPAADALMVRARSAFEALPERAIDPDGNRMTPEKVALGRQLFFDGRLSSSGVISCNSCHNLGMGGVDGVATSIGHGFHKGPRNAPSVYNAALNVAQFWDGRAKDLKAQAKGPIVAAVEMNARPDDVVRTLRSIPGYVDGFARAFPDDGDPVSFDNVAKAIEAFEVTLLTPDAPFDRYLRGEAGVLGPEAQRGLTAFMDKGCVACHSGVNIGGGGYFPFGVQKKPDAKVLPRNDKGRIAVTRVAGDEYVFRAAPLRNVALTAPYFHSGQVWNLHDAVKVMSDSQLGSTLSAQEIDDVVAFPHSLTGKQPDVVYPQLPPRSDETPVPASG